MSQCIIDSCHICQSSHQSHRTSITKPCSDVFARWELTQREKEPNIFWLKARLLFRPTKKQVGPQKISLKGWAVTRPPSTMFWLLWRPLRTRASPLEKRALEGLGRSRSRCWQPWRGKSGISWHDSWSAEANDARAGLFDRPQTPVCSSEVPEHAKQRGCSQASWQRKRRRRGLLSANSTSTELQLTGSTVMYSDESTFCCIRARSRVRRPIGSNRWKPWSTLILSWSGAWGCFLGSCGRGGLWFLPKNTTMNGERFKTVLRDHLTHSWPSSDLHSSCRTELHVKPPTYQEHFGWQTVWGDWLARKQPRSQPCQELLELYEGKAEVQGCWVLPQADLEPCGPVPLQGAPQKSEWFNAQEDPVGPASKG